MIQVFRGKRCGFSKKELGVLAPLSFPVERHDSNPIYFWYNLNHFRVVSRVSKSRINSNMSNGLNRLNLWVDYATIPAHNTVGLAPHGCSKSARVSSRKNRRGEEVMFYTERGLKIGTEFILTRHFSQYKRSGVASTYLTRAMDSEGASDHKLLGLLDSPSSPLNKKRAGTLLDKIYNKFAISCKESRIETNTSFYGCFYLGPFEQGESVTIANALRRTLLSDLMGVAITSVEIEGAVHEYASITGVRESVLDILLNLKEITLKQTTLSSSTTFTPQGQMMPLAASDSILTPYLVTNPPTANQKGVMLNKSKVPQPNSAASNYLERKKKGWGNQVGYLRARGPGVIRASDLKLPPYIVCVDPEQYIATLSDDGVLNMKFFISEGKNYLIQVPNKNLDLTELKRRRLFQKKIKQGSYLEGISKSFVRYVPLAPYGKPEIASDLRSSSAVNSQVPLANPKSLTGVKSFFNLRKQKKVFNDASNGNRLPIDAVFMPVTKVNYIIEPDEQSNDEQLNEESFNDSKSEFTSNSVTKALSADLGGIISNETRSPFLKNDPYAIEGSMQLSEKRNTLFVDPTVDSLSAEFLADGRPSLRVGGAAKSLSLLPLTPEQVLAEFQNLGLKRRSEEEQRAFSNLLVNPILKNQPPSLFFKHSFNLLPPVPEVVVDDIKIGSAASKIALRDIADTQNGRGPGYSKEQSLTAQGVDTSSSPLFSTISEGLKKGSLRQKKKGSSNVNFTFLHPAPFLSLQDKQGINENLNGLYKAQSDATQEEVDSESRPKGVGLQQVSFKDKKQQELIFFDKSQMQNMVAKEQIVAQEVFTKKNPLKYKIILEIWTNGSIHPRKALYDSFKSMITLFSRLQKVRILGSMLKSERFYNKLIDKKFNRKNVILPSQSRLSNKKNLTFIAGEDTPQRGSWRSQKGEPSVNSWQSQSFEATKQLSYDANNKNAGFLSSANECLPNSFSLDDVNPLFKPVLSKPSQVQGNKKIKSKGLYSINKTVTSLQTYLPAAVTFVTGGKQDNKMHMEGEWSGDNCGESGDDKLSEKEQLDLITIESLNLSLRSYTCLKRSNINTINDLMGNSKKQLIQIKNFGVHSLEEIQTRLGVFGFKLKP